MNAHTNIQDDLADAISAELASNVLQFAPKQSDAADGLEKLDDVLRNVAAKAEARIVARRKSSKARIASIREQVARLTAEIAREQASAKHDIEADKMSIAKARAALAVEAE